jgi:hypothetical protein
MHISTLVFLYYHCIHEWMHKQINLGMMHKLFFLDVIYFKYSLK